MGTAQGRGGALCEVTQGLRGGEGPKPKPVSSDSRDVSSGSLLTPSRAHDREAGKANEVPEGKKIMYIYLLEKRGGGECNRAWGTQQ